MEKKDGCQTPNILQAENKLMELLTCKCVLIFRYMKKQPKGRTVGAKAERGYSNRGRGSSAPSLLDVRGLPHYHMPVPVLEENNFVKIILASLVSRKRKILSDNRLYSHFHSHFT